MRGHHLICLHFFSGEGYNKEFIENLRNILDIARDRGLEICQGPDDICRECPYLINERCQYSEHADVEIKEMDSKAVNLLKLASGMRISWYQIERRLSEIFKDWFELYCNDCDWKRACENKGFYQQLKNQSVP